MTMAPESRVTQVSGTHRWPIKFQWEGVAALAIGLLVFLSLRGARIVRPGNTDWLMSADPITYQTGWQFFRQTPWLQWPLGANPAYGMELGSSIVFTDSIPLLAILFKVFNPLLPATFQYFGMWLAACFCLQSFFAFKLLRRFTEDPLLALAGCAFFAVAPVFLFRLAQSHLALMAQWIVLASLWLHFAPRLHTRKWIVLLLLSTWIHAYLLVMAWLIWCADMLQRLILGQAEVRGLGLRFAAGTAAIATAMWAAGYFMLGSDVGTGGFSIYRTNLIALFDPDNVWSLLLRTQPHGPGDYEGFAYLGVGMLALAAIALAELLRTGAGPLRPGVAPLVVMALVLTVFAVSPRVAFGSHELFAYPLPDFVKPAVNAFRVSGRFFWPVYYLLLAGVLYVIFSRLPKRAALVLCVAALVLQIADSAEGWKQLKTQLAKAPVWSSPMRSAAWEQLAVRYDKLLLISPHSVPVSWIASVQFASRHRMSVNTGLFARIRQSTVDAMNAGYVSSIERSDYRADALYLFDDDGMWKLALSKLRPGDVAGTLDGFRILAPGLGRCTDCAFAAAIVPAR